MFRMPAMSPTMEAGGVVAWKVAAGQTFASGDQLLDVETDKATIAVDAVDDGVLVKILKNDGEKDIPVGTPIAVMAEPDDDLATLEMPDLGEETVEAAPAAQPTSSQSAESKSGASASSGANSVEASASQTFLPSVELLLQSHGIARADALAKIRATGPHGRILKGDVMAYLGEIPSGENEAIAEYVEKHTHLDLANIELRATQQQGSNNDSAVAGAATDASAADSSAASAPPAPKPATVLTHEYAFTQDASALAGILHSAERAAYATPKHVSDLDDPLFDAILAPSVDRFSVETTLDGSVLTVALTLNSKAYDAADRAKVYFETVRKALL